MAVNVVIPLLIPLEENLYNATRLVSESGGPLVVFSEPRYCAVLSEDSQLASTVLAVSATHSKGAAVRYSITAGNRDGLFTIDQHTGIITLAAALDHETHTTHELVVWGEGGGGGATTLVQVRVADINDNPPYFLHPRPEVTVVEEDHRHLPATIATVVAEDQDFTDHHGLLYTVRGDGVDVYAPGEAFFTINSLTGELIQLRALDRDPPRGKAVWKVRVQVRDGQALWSRQAMQRYLANKAKATNTTTTHHNTRQQRRTARDFVFSANSGRKSYGVYGMRKRYGWTKRKHVLLTRNETYTGRENQHSKLATKSPDGVLRGQAIASVNKEATQLEYGAEANPRGQRARRSGEGKRRFSESVEENKNEEEAKNFMKWASEDQDGEEARIFREWVGDEQRDLCGGNVTEPEGGRQAGAGRGLHGLGGSLVHVAETEVTIRVKDVNDNPPVFPNTTMFGLVQENGPIDLSVAQVAAWDADDDSEGSNARVSYGIHKNAMCERTGEPLFSIDPKTGLVRTAVCCLDRETTTHYQIQVVATDGGGLQGTGVVVVRLADVNDNAPQLEQKLWEVEVDETWGNGPPDNSTVLEISVLDPDTSNYFHYRVVHASGWGWQHFGVRSVGAVGHIYAHQTLDYEDEAHRRGFRFMVQVTDRGRGGWEDARHLDSAWVVVRLRDVNDNPPHFTRQNVHITVREDAKPGTLLASFPAQDPDDGGHQEVDYRVEGGWGAVSVDSAGGVSLHSALDREAPDGAVGVARILGVDCGHPPLTATATLTITLTDVNDTPPLLLPPTLFHVTEDAAPTRLGVLTATDEDVWALGHGPPFTLSLAPTNLQHVLDNIALDFDSHLDSGRGGAELRTAATLDREQYPQLLVAVIVADAGGLTATHTVTVVVDDINDNPMQPGTKTVYLWKPQGGAAEAPLGRVFVEDPDDWDLNDKTYSWAGSPHPLFSLNTRTGDLLASSQVREGRYELCLAVSDRLWGQKDVGANVTVVVRVLPPDAVAHAAPLTLTPTTPEALTRGWTPQDGRGGLGRVVDGVRRVLGGAAHTVEVLSVEGQHALHSEAPPVTAVWLSVKVSDTGYMDPVKLRGLLALHAKQLEAATNLTVVMEAATVVLNPESRQKIHDSPLGPPAASCPSTSLPFQVVDTNSTALVTPRLTRAQDCSYRDHQTCTPSSCHNGGRCLPSGGCVCPGGSWGPQCKILSRTFSGKDWAWVRPLPPCLPLTISLRLLTRRPHALVLYSGPLAPMARHPNHPPTPMLAVQLWCGRPQLLVEGVAGVINLEVSTAVNDGDWHALHLRLSTEGVAMVVDLCGRGYHNTSVDDGHCAARASWSSPKGLAPWLLQVGGLAHTPPSSADHGWREAPTRRPLTGCISHLRINGQLVDLGEPAHSRGGLRGCQPQERACEGGCGHRGQCVGGLNQPQCECDPGWTGSGCDTPTLPATFSYSSYIKLALTFTPAAQVVTVQLRLRTRGAKNIMLLSLAAHQNDAAFTLYLQEGVACVRVSGTGWTEVTACVEGKLLGDGEWHTVRGERHGHSLVVAVDDGDGWHRNESLAVLAAPGEEAHLGGPPRHSPLTLHVDTNDGVMLGKGSSELLGTDFVDKTEEDEDSSIFCVDDVRVCGHGMPLPPIMNTSRWGQVTSWQGLESGCSAPDACLNTTCHPPLTCISTWGTATCSCGPRRHVVGHSCRDVDECLLQPCLHGGTCNNLQPGYQCVCSPTHTGDHCQWTHITTAPHPLTAPLAIATFTLSVLMLVVAGVVLSLRLRQQWFTRGHRNIPREMQEEAGQEGDTNLQGDERHHALLERLTLPPASSSQEQGVADVKRNTTWPDPLPAKEDLRAYTYGGDGSSAESLSSAQSGVKEEFLDRGNVNQVMPGFQEVIDILQNLPEAARSPALKPKPPNIMQDSSKGKTLEGPSSSPGPVPAPPESTTTALSSQDLQPPHRQAQADHGQQSLNTSHTRTRGDHGQLSCQHTSHTDTS